MVSIPALWLPIVLSAVVVFVASSIIHMVLKYHHNDYRTLPDEEKLMAAMREAGLRPGAYACPRPADMKDMSSPEMIEKYKLGPVAHMTVLPSGPPAMGKALGLWFAFSLVIGIFAAYLGGRHLAPGADYLAVFRITGAVAFVGYGASYLVDSIWKGVPWSITVKSILDGLVYALLTAGVFGWLWP